MRNACRLFAGSAYLHALDPAHEILLLDPLPRRTRRAVPYLYTDAEALASMDATSVYPTPHRAATMRTLIGLLAVTGMRVERRSTSPTSITSTGC